MASPKGDSEAEEPHTSTTTIKKPVKTSVSNVSSLVVVYHPAETSKKTTIMVTILRPVFVEEAVGNITREETEAAKPCVLETIST